MKIRCPGCSKVLNVPETAAGKVVKCPCGKQLRAPAGGGAPATPAQPAAPAQRPVAQRPAAPVAQPAQPVAPQAIPAQAMPAQAVGPQATPAQPMPAQPMPAQPMPAQPMPAQPIPAQPQQPTPYPWRPAAPAPPDDMFSDLTEGDLQGVKPVTRPGATAGSSPRGIGGSSVYAEAGVSPDEGNRRNFLLIAGNVALGLGAMGAGGGLIYWDLTREQDDDEGGYRRRRRTPIGAGIALIITGGGWLIKGFFGGDD